MDNKLLVQDNALTTARYEMTALEKNIMYAVMAQIEDNDLPNKCYKISLTEISKFTNRRVRNDDFKDAIQRLLTRDFFIKDNAGYLQSTFIASALSPEISQNCRAAHFFSEGLFDDTETIVNMVGDFERLSNGSCIFTKPPNRGFKVVV